MRWDDAVFEGERDQWRWFFCRKFIDHLPTLVIRDHPHHRLWIVTFDSGKITPTPEERTLGWRSMDGVMVSPPLFPGLEIPCDQCDEWYIFSDDQPLPGDLERFVNYSGFNLADPQTLASSFDPTWERTGLDWLYPIQNRFWLQLDRVAPVSYIARGDNEIVVTRNQAFADSIHQAMQ